MSHLEDKEIEYELISSQKDPDDDPSRCAIRSRFRIEGRRILIRSFALSRCTSTTYLTAHRVTDSAEHHSKHHVRAREDDMPSESKRKQEECYQ